MILVLATHTKSMKTNPNSCGVGVGRGCEVLVEVVKVLVVKVLVVKVLVVKVLVEAVVRCWWRRLCRCWWRQLCRWWCRWWWKWNSRVVMVGDDDGGGDTSVYSTHCENKMS